MDSRHRVEIAPENDMVTIQTDTNMLKCILATLGEHSTNSAEELVNRHHILRGLGINDFVTKRPEDTGPAWTDEVYNLYAEIERALKVTYHR